MLLETHDWRVKKGLYRSGHARTFWPVTRTKGVELAAKIAADLGLSSKQVMTFAGPDSINITDLVPTVTLFVPNVDGISHNEHE